MEIPASFECISDYQGARNQSYQHSVKLDWKTTTMTRKLCSFVVALVSILELKSCFNNNFPTRLTKQPNLQKNIIIVSIIQSSKGKGHPRPGHLVAIRGCVVNATPWPLYPHERPGTHCIVHWVGLRAGLDGCGKPPPPRDSIPGPSSP